MIEFKFPDVGEGIEEGEIVKWHVREGQKVRADQVLVDVETDKAVVNIPSPVSGTLVKIFVKEGQRVKVGQVLVTIAADGEKIMKEHRSVSVVGELEEAPEEVAAPEHEKFVFKDGHHAKTLRDLMNLLQTITDDDFAHHVNERKNDFANWIRHSLRKETLAAKVEQLKSRQEMLQVIAGKKRVLATPKVRRLAKEQGINLATITGSGPEGRIREADLGSGAEQKAKVSVTKKYDLWGYVERVPLRGVRKVTAQRMSQAWSTIPHVTHFDEADVTALVDLREKKKVVLAKQKVKLTFLPFIMRACCAALRAFPFLNASLEGEEIVLKKYYNFGFAVATDDGLFVPVLKGVEKKTIPAIAQEVSVLAEKARKRTIDLMDMKGGTFTITNMGSIGGTYFTPIINAPEVAILGVGRIEERVVSRNGKIVARKMLPLSLSFDHRVVDGAYAAQFMNAVKKLLEDADARLR